MCYFHDGDISIVCAASLMLAIILFWGGYNIPAYMEYRREQERQFILELARIEKGE